MIVEMTGFMSHDRTVVELPDHGLVQITGPNGAGKSALIEAFAVALWGRGARSLRWSPWRATEDGVVAITDGALTVRRSCSAAGKKKLSWQLVDAPEDFDTNTKGQEALDNVIGSFDSWRRTSVFSSADAAHFTLATDAERKELLEELLGLGWFDRALQLCRKDLHAARTAVGLAERERDLLAARADEAAKLVRQAHEHLAETPDPGDAGLLRVELSKVDGYLKDIRSETQTMNERRAELLGAGGEALSLSRELKARLERMASGNCSACGQEIPQRLLDSLEEKAAKALRESVDARAANADEIKKLASALAELEEEADALRAKKRTLDTRLQSITQARTMRTRLQRDADAASQGLHEMGQRVVQAASVIEKHRVDVAELEACDKVLGVRGARSVLVGRTLSGIEALANTWMAKLGSSIEIRLKPYTEKKSGGTVDSISLSLVGAGGEGGYLGASAGERRRVDVAILLALAELADGAAHGRRWKSPIFFDEVFDGLDEDGREAVMELMAALSKDRLVVLITHNESLAAERADVRLRVDGGTIT